MNPEHQRHPQELPQLTQGSKAMVPVEQPRGLVGVGGEKSSWTEVTTIEAT